MSSSASARLVFDRRDDRRGRTHRLRAARAAANGCGSPAAIAHAFASCPTCRHARRLHIEGLLAADAVPKAMTLIDEGMLLYPSDAGLSRLRAECLLRLRRVSEAQRELRVALRRRPHHIGTGLLAARIERAQNNYPAAIARLRSMTVRRTDAISARRLLVGMLIEAGAVRRARRAFDALAVPCPLLAARLAAAEGEPGRALDILEQARRTTTDARVTCELIDRIEAGGDLDRLRRLLRIVRPTQPLAVIRAGEASLRLGEFESAIRAVAPVRDHDRCGSAALAILAVAAAQVGRMELFELAMRRLRRRRGGVDVAFMAELWRRAMTAAAFGPETTSVHEVKPGSVLPGLLAAAAATMRHVRGPSPAERTRHRATCLTALDRRRTRASA